jgi:hypothetical protein
MQVALTTPLENDQERFAVACEAANARPRANGLPPVDVTRFHAIAESKQMRRFSGDPVVLQTLLPYVVRVVCATDGVSSAGTGTVMQYRCGGPGAYRSAEWWLVTNSHVVCRTGSVTLEAEGYVQFFFESGATPTRVDLDMQCCRLLSPPPLEGSDVSLDALDIAVIRSVRVQLQVSLSCFIFLNCSVVP